MNKLFIDWAKEKYSSSSNAASAVLAKFGNLARDQKICCMEDEFVKLLKAKHATDAEISTLHSMFEIYKKEAK